jgi:hypothetical protein
MATDPRMNSRQSIALGLAVGAGVFLIAKSVVAVSQAQKRRSQTLHLSKPSRQPSVQMRDWDARIEMSDATPIANDGGAPNEIARRSNPHFVRRDATQNPSYDMRPFMGNLVEQSVDQAQNALNTFIDNTREATKNLRGLGDSIHLPVNAALVHGLDLSEQSVSATFVLARNLVQADDLRSVIQIQATYALEQFDIWQNGIGLLAGLSNKSKQ